MTNKINFNHKKRVTFGGAVALNSGLNLLTDEELERLKKHPSYKDLTDRGVLTIVKEPAKVKVVETKPITEAILENVAPEEVKPKRTRRSRAKKVEEDNG